VIEPKKKTVLVAETVPIPRQTVSGLIETLQAVFSSRSAGKPVRVLYNKGEDLLVERMVLASDLPDNPFLTPYEMIRQHSELEILEMGGGPVVGSCKAAQRIGEEGYELKNIVCHNVREVESWFSSELQIRHVFRVPIHEDPDCPEGCIFFCGSRVSEMIRDIEYAVLCRME
jgi:hypothetical protein